ncbi:ParB/RepB/Spo0J family partition protein [Methylobacter sp.]|jgi:ParB family chromosome partitioning protein|uniref:ParB/RepB/Spo0J family partition protein n=1 Tax=Methylobacter sp. TaxID=2051955 RepID=UPI003DA4AB98
MKKPVTVSGLIQSGAVRENAPDVLPKFKGQSDFSNSRSVDIPLSQIKPNPYQPRRIFPEAEITDLANSIEEIGLIQPIAIRKVDDNQYQIIAGERRYRAFKQLNKEMIPAMLFACDDGDMAVMAITENVNREDLSDFEIAKSIRNVESLFPTKKRLAEALGIQREDMYRYFAFESLPDLITEKLAVNPRLISRNAAADIKRVLNNCLDNEYDHAMAALKEALHLLENSEIDQGKIANFIIQKVKREISGSVNKEKEEFFAGSKRIGYFSTSNNGIMIKISSGILDADKTEQLKNTLNELIKGAKSIN